MYTRILKGDSFEGIAVLTMTLMQARTFAHLLHLQTKSYAQHMALGSFYEGVSDLVDSLVEAWQGKYGVIPAYPNTIAPFPTLSAIPFIEGVASAVKDSRGIIAPEDTELLNILDEIISLIDSTAYKLKNLS